MLMAFLKIMDNVIQKLLLWNLKKILMISKSKGLPVMKKILMNKTTDWLILPQT